MRKVKRLFLLIFFTVFLLCSYQIKLGYDKYTDALISLPLDVALLSGKIFCGECGASYRRRTRQTKKENELFWRCANRIEHGNRNCKNSITVSNDEMQINYCFTNMMKR